ncbi:MAG: hypothetical protein U9Q06_00520 [Nanoarchaeota archaeon]|nr:hypothetical protein [Nanoarchaeota archaeon]
MGKRRVTIILIVFILLVVIFGVWYFSQNKKVFSPLDCEDIVKIDIDDYCSKKVSVLRVNHLVCKNDPNFEIRDNCYLELAQSENDEELCEEIYHPLIRASCHKLF